MNIQNPKYFDNPPQTAMGNSYNDTLPLQPFETFELTPGCMYICFMLPFPFFCLGCCLSKTAKFRFDNNSHMLSLVTYCGFCACCAAQRQIPYDEIIGTDIRPLSGTYINDQPAFNVYLIFRGGEVQLTGGMVYAEAIGTDMELRTIMTRSRIAAGRRAPTAPMAYGMGIFLGPMYY